MEMFRQQLPMLLLAIAVGMLLAHAVRVQGFVYDRDTADHCHNQPANTTDSNHGRTLGLQINGDWFIWVDCATP